MKKIKVGGSGSKSRVDLSGAGGVVLMQSKHTARNSQKEDDANLGLFFFSNRKDLNLIQRKDVPSGTSKITNKDN